MVTRTAEQGGTVTETVQVTRSETTVEGFAEQVLGDYAGANAFLMAGLGDRLGLFAVIAANEPQSSAELADRTGLQERYLREWLAGMAAAGYLTYDPPSGRYAIPDAHVPVLAEEAGVWFFGAAFFDFSTNYGETFHRLLEAFRSGGGVAQEVYGEEVAASIDRFTAPWFEHRLVPEWIPAMPNVQALLAAGAVVCDVGCGRGRALITLAEAFPQCQFVGIDAYEPAIPGAREQARNAGVQDRVRFEVADATSGLPWRFEVITTFDVIHDSADPRGILRAIHDALVPTGRYVCVDINCADNPEDNAGPLGTVLYGSSHAYCLPVSLAAGGAGLGTLGLPPSRLSELAHEAGFADLRQVPTDDRLTTCTNSPRSRHPTMDRRSTQQGEQLFGQGAAAIGRVGTDSTQPMACVRRFQRPECVAHRSSPASFTVASG
jgi:2-polyprenyl-3-methyl-5-hydroxy-6-metoxy-1,4-benzoquinol methylase